MTDRYSGSAPAVIEHLRAHPQFQAAMRAAARGILGLYRGNRILNSLMSDRARAMFTNAALHLHFSGTSDGRPGLTVGAMKDLCVQLRLCSRGRCEATLALLRAAGYFAAVPSGDRRRRPLVPTEKLLTLMRKRWSAHLAATSCVLPEAAGSDARLDDPAFAKRFLLALSEVYIGGTRMIGQAPELEMFIDRNAGLMILYSLALSGPAEGPFPPHTPVPLSINALAKSLSVSRKHVLTLLRDAEAQGLLARGGAANGEITLLPRLRTALEMFFAAIFLTFAQSAAQAARECDAGPHCAVA